MMEDRDFSDAFCRFLQTSVTSVDAAELLLVLSGSPDRAWTVPELVAALRPAVALGEAEAAKHIELFHARGLVSLEEAGRVRYRAVPELEGFVATMALAYKERPVTLIRMIYALRDSKIRTFADAFKIRKS